MRNRKKRVHLVLYFIAFVFATAVIAVLTLTGENGGAQKNTAPETPKSNKEEEAQRELIASTFDTLVEMGWAQAEPVSPELLKEMEKKILPIIRGGKLSVSYLMTVLKGEDHARRRIACRLLWALTGFAPPAYDKMRQFAADDLLWREKAVLPFEKWLSAYGDRRRTDWFVLPIDDFGKEFPGFSGRSVSRADVFVAFHAFVWFVQAYGGEEILETEKSWLRFDALLPGQPVLRLTSTEEGREELKKRMLRVLDELDITGS